MRELFSKIYTNKKEIIHYLVVGCLTTVVSLGTYYACVCTFLDPENPIQLQIANVLSWLCAVLFAFFTNRKYVFESRDTNWQKEALLFVGSRIATLVLDMGSMFFMVTFLQWNDKVAKLIVQVLITISNYLLSKFLVFKKK